MNKKKKSHFICYVPGITMYMDRIDPYLFDITETYDLDRFRCFLVNMTATLYNFYIGHICIGILLFVIAISLFGRIKEDYRWFILNQAAWDLLISYNFICHNFMENIYSYFSNGSHPFYYFSYFGVSEKFTLFYLEFFATNQYNALLLLSISRFLCLFFTNFYEKLSKKRRIFYTIIVFNLILLSFHLHYLFELLAENRQQDLEIKCTKKLKGKHKSSTYECLLLTDWVWHCYDTLAKVFYFITKIKPLLCLLLSVLATAMIFFRIGKQAKFQLKNNQKAFVSSVQVAIVIFLQILINTFLFIPEFIGGIINDILFMVFGISSRSSQYELACEFIPTEECVDLRLPLWLNGKYGLSDPDIQSTLIQLRIVIEAIIILLIMTGYREAITTFIKFIYNFVKNYARKRSKVSKQSVTLTRVSAFDSTA